MKWGAQTMRFFFLAWFVCHAAITATGAETQAIDLPALAKKARPAVFLLIVYDANGKEIATGTGFLVSNGGKLITNYHVIAKAHKMVAKAENGGLFPVAGILAVDAANDLALLKLEGKDLTSLPLGSSEKVEAGIRIVVIGSPLGLEGTLSEGIVSAVREFPGRERWLQITAAISPGSSGSPVLNANGEVIGIATLLITVGQSLNFAVPIEVARSLLARAQKTDKPQPFATYTIADEDAIYTDPDFLAAAAAKVNMNHAEVLKHVQALVKKYPDHYFAHFGLGVAYSHLNFTADAIAAFRQVIKLKTDYADAWVKLGVAYGQSGRSADAIAACQQAIKLKPDFAEAWGGLGFVYEQSGRHTDAIAAYQQAIKLEPDCADAWACLGVIYGRSGRSADAIAACQQAIKLKPDFAEAWGGLGFIYQKAGKTAEAAAALQKARELDPSLFK